MKFDKATAVKLRDEIENALKAIGEKHGIKINTGSCTFSELEINFKLHLKNSDPEAIKNKRKEDWEMYCKLYNFEKEDLGKEFTTPDGQKYRILGLNLKRQKYDLIAVNLSDKRESLFVSAQIARMIGRTGAVRTIECSK